MCFGLLEICDAYGGYAARYHAAFYLESSNRPGAVDHHLLGIAGGYGVTASAPDVLQAN